MVGRRIAGFAIERLIASGGMGSVYLAVQEKPRRKVALKVMKPGIISHSTLRRFEFESQTLARLSHPNIAQVYEAGTHDDGSGGVPYFVMEYVTDASEIIAYADTRNLNVRERIELFTKVCDAVQHGHQNGVIHRDLKPSNILANASGEPKIIDFGVARATDSDLAVATMETQVGQLVGTLQYMSPEQCAADPAGLDTRSDVYSLGMVLYCMLCGTLPYDLTGSTIMVAVSTIQDRAPTRPSDVHRSLRGDLETIMLKALEKDRVNRYVSAAALGDDLRRYLAGEAIEAHPPSTMYQLTRFAQRNRILVGGVVAVIMTLSAGIVTTGLALSRATEAEGVATRRAEELDHLARFQVAQMRGMDAQRLGEQVRASIVENTRNAMGYAGVDVAEIEARTARLAGDLESTNFTDVALDALDENIFQGAMDALEEDFLDQPLVRAQLLQSLATTMREIGLVNRASKPQDAALNILRSELGEEHPETLASLRELGLLYRWQGRPQEAERVFEQCLEIRRRRLGDEHPDTILSVADLGENRATDQGRYDASPASPEAEAERRRVLEERRDELGADHPQTLNAMVSLAGTLRLRGRDAEALALLEAALPISRRVFGSDHPSTLKVLDRLTFSLGDQRRSEDAGHARRELYERRRRIAGADAQIVLRSAVMLANHLIDTGEPGEAERLIKELLAQTTLSSRSEWLVADLMSTRGLALTRLGRYAEAEPLLVRGYEDLLVAQPEDYAYRTHVRKLHLDRIATMYENWGKPNEAARWRARQLQDESEWERQLRESIESNDADEE